jgi:hypothetical protein
MGEGDLETCCLGPVEFDIAHAPTEVGEHYPGADQDLLDLCRILMRAMVTAWRWDREDQFPNGLHWRIGGLNQLRAALDREGLDVSTTRLAAVSLAADSSTALIRQLTDAT